MSLPLLPLIPNAIATDAPRKEKTGDGEEEEADVPDEKAPLLYLLWLYLLRPYLLWLYLLWLYLLWLYLLWPYSLWLYLPRRRCSASRTPPFDRRRPPPSATLARARWC